MKLHRSARSERPTKGRDVLLSAEAAPGRRVFDIERDVKPSDWQHAKQHLETQWNEGKRFELALDVGQLVLLGADNRSGVDMERWKRRSLVQAQEELEVVIKSFTVKDVSEKVAAWLLVDPGARDTLLTEQLPQPQQLALWEEFEKLVKKSRIEQNPEVLAALFLLFPAERDRLRAAVSLEALTEKFQSRLAQTQQLWTEAYYYALAIGLLFPGNHEDIIPPGTVEQQRQLWGRGFLTTRAISTLYLLSADEVQVTTAGEVKVVKSTQKLKQGADLPERKLV